MNQQMIIAVLLSFLATTILFSIIGGLLYLRWWLWRRKNPIDVVIFDLFRGGLRIRSEVGRKVYTDNGWNVVTSKWLSNKVKDQLGYNISEHDMEPSNKRNRQYLLVAMKNGFSSSLQYAADELKLSTEEQKLLQKLEEQLQTPGVIKLDNIPRTLTLNPLIQNQTRFAINHAKDQAKLYKDEDLKHARRLQMVAMGVVALSLIIALVILVVAINQAPAFAQQVTAKAVETTTQSVVPGIPVA